MKRQYFTKDDVWNGGFYELAIEIGPTSDQRLKTVLTTVWSHPTLQGCYRDPTKEPDEQQRLDPQSNKVELEGHLHGIARLPNGIQVACGTCTVREENGSDWLDLYIPMGALSEGYEVRAYPFGEKGEYSEDWQRPVEDWLVAIGHHVFSQVKFALALIGFEVSGEYYAEEIENQGVPEQRFIGYLWPSGEKLTYYPRNILETPFLFPRPSNESKATN